MLSLDAGLDKGLEGGVGAADESRVQALHGAGGKVEEQDRLALLGLYDTLLGVTSKPVPMEECK